MCIIENVVIHHQGNNSVYNTKIYLGDRTLYIHIYGHNGDRAPNLAIPDIIRDLVGRHGDNFNEFLIAIYPNNEIPYELWKLSDGKEDNLIFNRYNDICNEYPNFREIE